MKLTHTELAGNTDFRKADRRHESGFVSRTAARFAFIGALGIASLAGGNAFAQTPNPESPQVQPVAAAPAVAPSAARPEYRVRGETTSLTDGSTSRSTYIVIRGSPTPSVIEVEGPARLTVRFYPVVDRTRFATPQDEVERTISYSLGPAGGTAEPLTHTGTTGMTDFTNPDVDQNALVIGRGMDMAINVAAGRHALSFPDMNGFFEVINVEPPPAPRPIQPAIPVSPPQPVPNPPTPEPGHEYGEIDESLRPVVSVEFERAPLRGIGTQGLMEDGSSGNMGDLYFANAIGTIRLSDRFGLMLGGMFSTCGLTLIQPQWETALRGYFGNLAAGVSFQQDGHYAYLLAYGGYSGIATNIQSYSDGRSLDTLFSGFGFGGMAGYEYGRFVRLRVSGGNNPFNPLSVRAYGALPYTWTPGVYPFVQADFLWLHAMTPAEGSNQVGLIALNENSFNMRAIAGVPIWRLGPVVPYVLGGGEFNIAGGSVTNGTGIFGGGLRTDFIQGLDIDVAAGATLHGDPLVFLNMVYAR